MPIDLANKSLAELELLMRNPDLLQTEPEPAPGAKPPEPEPEPTSEPEPAPEEKPPEEEKPEEPTPEELEAQAIKAKIDEMEARQKKLESAAGRSGGEARFWRERAQQLERALKERQEPEPYAAEPSEPKPTPPKRDSVAAWAVAQAVRQAGMDFGASHPDAQELQADIEAYWKNSGFDGSSIINAEDPIEAAREATRAMEEAYYHARAEKMSKLRAELEAKKEVSTAKRASMKTKAAISGSGNAPAPKPQTKTLEQMSLSELDAELKERYGKR